MLQVADGFGQVVRGSLSKRWRLSSGCCLVCHLTVGLHESLYVVHVLVSGYVTVARHVRSNDLVRLVAHRRRALRSVQVARDSHMFLTRHIMTILNIFFTDTLVPVRLLVVQSGEGNTAQVFLSQLRCLLRNLRGNAHLSATLVGGRFGGVPARRRHLLVGLLFAAVRLLRKVLNRILVGVTRGRCLDAIVG